eukprot:NODE_176_length_14102_cov_0.889595.p6 type:complete len:323 gc:universal NODE_176_length_14102_cov_0.889595:11561-12529(+)
MSYRLKLAVDLELADGNHIIGIAKVLELMKLLKTPKGAELLKNYTKSVALVYNQTRWEGKYRMCKRFLEFYDTSFKDSMSELETNTVSEMELDTNSFDGILEMHSLLNDNCSEDEDYEPLEEEMDLDESTIGTKVNDILEGMVIVDIIKTYEVLKEFRIVSMELQANDTKMCYALSLFHHLSCQYPHAIPLKTDYPEINSHCVQIFFDTMLLYLIAAFKIIRNKRKYNSDCYENHLLTMNDDEFQEHMRIPPSAFNYNLNAIRQDRVMRIDARKAIYIFLWHIATGENYRPMGQRFGFAKGSIFLIVLRMAKLIQIYSMKSQ